MKSLLAVAIIILSCNSTFAGEVSTGKNGINITKIWMRPVILINRPTAIYFTITNITDKDDKLVKAQSVLASRIELHTNIRKNGVLKMTQVENIPVAANSTVKVAPGGYHLMVFGVNRKYNKGDEFPLMLYFEKGGRIPVVAKVMKNTPKESLNNFTGLML